MDSVMQLMYSHNITRLHAPPSRGEAAIYRAKSYTSVMFHFPFLQVSRNWGCMAILQYIKMESSYQLAHIPHIPRPRYLHASLRPPFLPCLEIEPGGSGDSQRFLRGSLLSLCALQDLWDKFSGFSLGDSVPLSPHNLHTKAQITRRLRQPAFEGGLEGSFKLCTRR